VKGLDFVSDIIKNTGSRSRRRSALSERKVGRGEEKVPDGMEKKKEKKTK